MNRTDLQVLQPMQDRKAKTKVTLSKIHSTWIWNHTFPKWSKVRISSTLHLSIHQQIFLVRCHPQLVSKRVGRMEFIKKSMEGGRVNHDFSWWQWLMTFGVLDDILWTPEISTTAEFGFHDFSIHWYQNEMIFNIQYPQTKPTSEKLWNMFFFIRWHNLTLHKLHGKWLQLKRNLEKVSLSP